MNLPMARLSGSDIYVMLALRSSSRPVVVADEQRDGTGQASQHDVAVTGDKLDVEMSRQGLHALDEKPPTATSVGPPRRGRCLGTTSAPPASVR